MATAIDKKVKKLRPNSARQFTCGDCAHRVHETRKTREGLTHMVMICELAPRGQQLSLRIRRVTAAACDLFSSKRSPTTA